MQAIRGLNADQAKRHAETWFACMEAGRNCPENEWPEMKRRQKPTPQIDALAELLMLVIRLEAEKQGVTVSAITSKSQVVAMLQEGRSTLSDDWRGELVNDVIADVRSQKAVLGVVDGKVQLLTD